jgi:hypothetical protein
LLPIYKAKVFESRIEKGGRTRPLVVTVRDNEGHLKQFVVKLYSKSDVQENKALGKEVLLIPLIEEFDLLTPSPALIRFDQGFINTLPRELQTEVIEKGAYLNFGCEYLDGSLTFNETIPQLTLDELDNVDTIFAFDVLLRNLDRRLTKPNLLIQERSIYLIDHEFCLIVNGDYENWEDPTWTFPVKNHVFYPYLSNKIKKTKEYCFSAFEDNLRRINVSKLTSYIEQLEAEQIPMPDTEILIDYLRHAKRNSHNFVTHLKGIL